MLIYRDNKKTCMKKLLVVLAILFVGILLAGCTTQPAAPVATPTPTPVPTVAPTVVATVVTTVAPTPVVTTMVNVTATPTPTPTPVPTYTITFTQSLTIVPDATAYVKTGTKVIWKNDDLYKPHGVQALDYTSAAYIGNGVRNIPYGGTLEATFDKPGSYDYTTVYQPAVVAKIVVS
jgi:plastocyanin